MTKRDAAVLACRVLALYLIAQSLAEFVHAFVELTGSVYSWGAYHGSGGILGEDLFMIWRYSGYFLMLAAEGVLLWWLAPSLGRVMAPEEPSGEAAPPSPPQALDRTGIMQVAFAVLGMYVLLKALSEVLSYAIRFAWYKKTGVYVSLAAAEILKGVILVGLGAWLVLGSRGLVSFIQSFRGAGRPQAQGQPSPQDPLQRVAPTIAVSGRFLRILLVLIVAALVILFVIALGVSVLERLS